MTQYGLWIGEASVLAVAVRRGTVTSQVNVAFGVDECELDSAVARALKAIGVGNRIVPKTIAVAVHRVYSWIKPVEGLPPVTDVRTMTDIVRENREKLFIGWEAGITPTNVRFVGEQPWAGAVDPEVIDEVTRGARRVRVRVGTVYPDYELLGLALAASQNRSWDSGRAVYFWFDGRGMLVERVLQGDGPAPDATYRDEFRTSPDPHGLAMAFGAATADRRFVGVTVREPLVRPSKTRMRWAASLAAATWIVAVVGPGVAHRVQASRAEATLANLGESYRDALVVSNELERFQHAFRIVGGFGADRVPVSDLLDELTEALPDEHAIVSFRVDGAGGQVVVLAPLAGTAISALETVSIITGLRIVGPVTREMVGDVERERFTATFDIVPPREL